MFYPLSCSCLATCMASCWRTVLVEFKQMDEALRASVVPFVLQHATFHSDNTISGSWKHPFSPDCSGPPGTLGCTLNSTLLSLIESFSCSSKYIWWKCLSCIDVPACDLPPPKPKLEEPGSGGIDIPFYFCRLNDKLSLTSFTGDGMKKVDRCGFSGEKINVIYSLWQNFKNESKRQTAYITFFFMCCPISYPRRINLIKP